MQPNKTGNNRMIMVAEHVILGVLCVSLLSFALILIRSGLSLT